MEVAASFVAEELNALLGDARLDWFSIHSTASLTFADRVEAFADEQIDEFVSQLANVVRGKTVEIATLDATPGRFLTITVSGLLTGSSQQRFSSVIRLDRTQADDYFVHSEAWTFFAEEPLEIAAAEAEVVADEVAQPVPEPTKVETSKPAPEEERAPKQQQQPTKSEAEVTKATGWAGVAAAARTKVPSSTAPTRVVAGVEKPHPEPEKKPATLAAPTPKPKPAKPEKPKPESCTVLKVVGFVEDADVLSALPVEIQSSVLEIRNKSRDLNRIFIDFSVADSFEMLVGRLVAIGDKTVTVERSRPTK